MLVPAVGEPSGIEVDYSGADEIVAAESVPVPHLDVQHGIAGNLASHVKPETSEATRLWR